MRYLLLLLLSAVPADASRLARPTVAPKASVLGAMPSALTAGLVPALGLSVPALAALAPLPAAAPTLAAPASLSAAAPAPAAEADAAPADAPSPTDGAPSAERAAADAGQRFDGGMPSPVFDPAQHLQRFYQDQYKNDSFPLPVLIAVHNLYHGRDEHAPSVAGAYAAHGVKASAAFRIPDGWLADAQADDAASLSRLLQAAGPQSWSDRPIALALLGLRHSRTGEKALVRAMREEYERTRKDIRQEEYDRLAMYSATFDVSDRAAVAFAAQYLDPLEPESNALMQALLRDPNPHVIVLAAESLRVALARAGAKP